MTERPAVSSDEIAAHFRRLAAEEEEAGVHPVDRSVFLAGKERVTPVLILHGTPGTAAEVGPLARALNADGHPVLTPLLPGHGRGEEQLGSLGWETCLERARECWAYARAMEGDVAGDVPPRASLIGFSFGGFLSLLLAAEAAPRALVTLAGYIYPCISPARRLMTPVAYLRAWRGSPIWRWRLQLAGLGARVLPLLSRIECPSLILQGEEDPTVSPRSARVIYEGLASRRKKLRLLPGMGHRLLEGGGEAAVANEVRAFLRAVDSPVARG